VLRSLERKRVEEIADVEEETRSKRLHVEKNLEHELCELMEEV
jgi:hypothetical protein